MLRQTSSSRAGTAVREEDYKVQPSKSHWLRSSVSPWINHADSRPPSFIHSLLSTQPWKTVARPSHLERMKFSVSVHVLGLWKSSNVQKEKTQTELSQSNTHLSMWAALKTTSNSPPSRRAAFSAISAASSSRDSSNKN